MGNLYTFISGSMFFATGERKRINTRPTKMFVFPFYLWVKTRVISAILFDKQVTNRDNKSEFRIINLNKEGRLLDSKNY